MNEGMIYFDTNHIVMGLYKIKRYSCNHHTPNPNIKSDKIWVYSRIETCMQKLIAYESAFIVINHSEQHFREEHDMYLCILEKKLGIGTFITLST